MIIKYHIAEERHASSVWEIPILHASERYWIKRASFIGNHALYADGGMARLSLIIRPAGKVAGLLTFEKDLPAFRPIGFQLMVEPIDAGDVLTLVKEPTRERNMSLPYSLVQVELQ